MTRKRTALLAVILLLSISAAHVLADGKKKKATTNTTTNQLSEFDSVHYRYFVFPQFYTFWPIDNNDTILKYECYDANQNFINVDTLYNIGNIYHIFFVKSFTDYTQTTIDADGKPHAMLIVKKLYKYDRTGTDTWTSFDYTHNYTGQLKEYKNEIVRTDTTTVIDPITATKQITIRKYYRVEEIDSAATNSSNDTTATIQSDAQQKSTVTTKIHMVPEFYYYGAKENNDTTIEFLCYDYRDSLMKNVANYDSVHYYSLMKSFIDSTHTYRDDDGKKKPLPVSTIIGRYDRIGHDKWMSIGYPGNKYTELTEYRDIIVKTDTMTLIDPVSDKTVVEIYNYYKIVK